jgi:hypothetical protein
MFNKYHYILIVICLGLISWTSISADKSKLLMRRWSLIDFTTPQIESNFKLRGITQERRAIVMKRLVEGSYLEFKPDGTYEVSILGSDPESLFWSYVESDSAEMIYVQKTKNILPKPIEVETLTKKELIILLPEGEGEYTKMHFVPAVPVKEDE